MEKKKRKRGEWIKIQAYAQEYGWRMVIDAVERAARVREAENMIRYGARSRKERTKNELRIIQKAEEMGVKLNG